MILGQAGIVFDPAYARADYKPIAADTYNLGSTSLYFRTAYLGASLVFNRPSNEISVTSTDGSDTKELLICGAEIASSNRSGFARFGGNENGSSPGYAALYSGGVTNARIVLCLNHSTAVIDIQNAGSTMWQFNATGQITQDATNGGSFIMQKSSSTMCLGANGMDADVNAVSGANPALYIMRNASSVADHIALIGIGNNNVGAAIKGYKTRTGSAADANTIVQSGDVLMSITALGADGASYRSAARIDFICDGTPGASDMPGGINFLTTADGAASPTQRLKLNQAGNLIFTNASFLIAADSGTNRVITICGDTNGSAGSYLSLMTDTTNAGLVDLSTGSAANSRIDIRARGANFGINFLTVNTQRWQIDNSGHLAQDTTNGGLLIFNKANTTMRFNGTMGNSTKAPQTVAPDDWVEINIAGTVYYLPAYLV